MYLGHCCFYNKVEFFRSSLELNNLHMMMVKSLNGDRDFVDKMLSVEENICISIEIKEFDVGDTKRK